MNQAKAAALTLGGGVVSLLPIAAPTFPSLAPLDDARARERMALALSPIPEIRD